MAAVGPRQEAAIALFADQNLVTLLQLPLHCGQDRGARGGVLLAKVRELLVSAMETQGRIGAWIVDDTGFVKKGVHSVGVARQYCGRLGKTDNCQVAVTPSVANQRPAWSPGLTRGSRIGCTFPRTGANDAARRREAHVPDDVK